MASRRYRISGNDDESSGLLGKSEKWRLEYGYFGINSPKVTYKERIKSDYQDRINGQYDIIWNDKEFGLWSFAKVICSLLNAHFKCTTYN